VEYYVGIDVSLELSNVCVVDGRGKIVKEAKVASEPEALVYFFKELEFPVDRITPAPRPNFHAGASKPPVIRRDGGAYAALSSHAIACRSRS
jgi:hypothetical protein